VSPGEYPPEIVSSSSYNHNRSDPAAFIQEQKKRGKAEQGVSKAMQKTKKKKAPTFLPFLIDLAPWWSVR